MEKIIFKCKNCQYKIEKTGYLDDIEDVVICPVCNTFMDLEGEDILVKAVKDDAIEKMRIQIEELGNNFCFRVIEDFKNVKTRLAYRDLFLRAGGVIPESEI
jgi:hypothetical protein